MWENLDAVGRKLSDEGGHEEARQGYAPQLWWTDTMNGSEGGHPPPKDTEHTYTFVP